MKALKMLFVSYQAIIFLIFIPEANSSTLYFPYTVSNGTWETEICLLNTSDHSVTGTLKAFQSNGTISGQDLSLTLAPNGRNEWIIGNSFPIPETISYMTFETEEYSISGYSKVYIEGSFRGAVPAVLKVNTNDIDLPHLASDDYWWTGICLLNTTNADKQVLFQFNDGSSGARTIGANSMDAFVIRDLFDWQVPDTIKSGVVKEADGIIGLAYFGSTEVSINNYLAGLSLNADRATLLYYPHAAPSDYSWTGIALSNPNISNTELTITPYAQDGTVLTGLPHILSASENYVGTLESLGFPAQTSWFKIESDLPVAGFELFGTKDGRQMAGLNAFTKASDSGVFPKHDTMERTDIAFVNVGRESTAVVLTAFDNTGNTVATASKTLSPYEKAIGRAADFFTSSIQTATYIRYTSDNPLIGYQINGSGDGYLLDSLPADINGTDETSASETSQLGYTIVDTGQTTYYGDSQAIQAPSEKDPFYGQDAGHQGNQPSYTLSQDGLTVNDLITGLTWTRSPDLNGDGNIDVNDKLYFSDAKAYPDLLNALNYGGYSDWRMPEIKELYSLINFNGTDPSESDDTGLIPFIDTTYFEFAYGDTAAGERTIDAQFWSSNAYAGKVFGNQSAAFGLNLADGRIKGYPTDGQMSKLNYVYFVRGNTAYGTNNFEDNADGTVTDKATGLMWSQNDSGAGMNWEEALAWVQQKNQENYLGYKDWRMPDAKEMQSIVDYSRAPETTGTAAIDPVFNITEILNEAGEADFPWFWTGTTHIRSNGSGESGVYMCFGRAMGYFNGNWLDVHGAGAQRSDLKSENFSKFNYEPDGYYFQQSPQGDAVRFYNYVRLVRDAN